VRVVIVRLRAKQPEAAALLARLRQQSRDSLELESQCRRFDVCLDPNDRDRICLYEIYDNQAAFEAHLRTSHFRSFDDDTRDWIDDKQVEIWDLDRQVATRDAWLAQ
jgi:(4S)-4-hydroxy-5-phosphonooxypentane-2,3-dione isomerase